MVLTIWLCYWYNFPWVLVEIHRVSWTYGFIAFIKFGKIWPLFFQISFCPSFLFFKKLELYIYSRLLKVFPQFTNGLFPPFFSSVHFGLVWHFFMIRFMYGFLARIVHVCLQDNASGDTWCPSAHLWWCYFWSPGQGCVITLLNGYYFFPWN